MMRRERGSVTCCTTGRKTGAHGVLSRLTGRYQPGCFSQGLNRDKVDVRGQPGERYGVSAGH